MAGHVDISGSACHKYWTRTHFGVETLIQTRSNKLRKRLTLTLFAGLWSLSLTQVSAEACSYREAMMALEQGNMIRGMALMRMASRDGDLRATNFLREQDYAQAVDGSEGFVAEVALKGDESSNKPNLKSDAK